MGTDYCFLTVLAALRDVTHCVCEKVSGDELESLKNPLEPVDPVGMGGAIAKYAQ